MSISLQKDEIIIKTKSPLLFKKKGAELSKTENQRFTSSQTQNSNKKTSNTWRQSTIAKASINLTDTLPQKREQPQQVSWVNIQPHYNNAEDIKTIKQLRAEIEIKKNKIKESSKLSSDFLKSINTLNISLNTSKEKLESVEKEITGYEEENQRLRDEIKEWKEKKAERDRARLTQQSNPNRESLPERRRMMSREVFENYIWSLLMSMRNSHHQSDNDAYPNVDNMTYEELLELEERIGNVSKGLSKDKINKIKKDKYSSMKYKESHKCIVCQFEYSSGETLKVWPCKHYYHPECIDQWWENQNVCPSCKLEVKIE